MSNEQTNQHSEKEQKTPATKLISYPKHKIPKNLKQLIDLSNSLQDLAESMFSLTSSVVTEELKKY